MEIFDYVILGAGLGVIGNGMNVVELITGESVRKIKDMPKPLVAPRF